MESLIPKQEKKIITDAYEAQTWKVALLISTFTYNHTTHYTYASVAGSELPTAGGYTIEGATLAGKASSYVDSTTVMLDATDLSWGPGATFSNVKYAVAYDTDTGLIKAIYEFAAIQSVSNGTFTIVWHANGLIRIA
jgi:hypothetical protein